MKLQQGLQYGLAAPGVSFSRAYDAARNFLHSHPVCSVEAFEHALTATMLDRISKFQRQPIIRQGRPIQRTRWGNLIDWVKATLTKEERIRYAEKDGVKYIVYVVHPLYLVEHVA